MNDKSQKVIYLYPAPFAFIKKDVEILSKHFKVITPKHDWLDKKRIFINFIQQFFFLLKNIKSSQAIFVMFGGYWSFLPGIFGKIFRTPVYIILGGSDSNCFPTFHYGNFRKPILKKVMKWSYQLATKLLPVDESLVESDYNYYEESLYKKQGYKSFLPSISTPYEVIYNGFDPQFFKGENFDKQTNSFVCVAKVSDQTRMKIKGIDIIIKLADNFKMCTFSVIGISKEMLVELGSIPKNLKLIPFLPQEEFRDILYQSEFVLQLSIIEGFPNALCEGMLCNCIPIGSEVGGIPKIIGDTGFIIERSNMDYIKDQFEKVLLLDQAQRLELAKNARKRIIDNFHLLIREQALVGLIEAGT